MLIERVWVASEDRKACRVVAPTDQQKTLRKLASYIGSRNYITFSEIERHLGLTKADVVLLKPDLEAILGVDITSLVGLDPPGLFIGDR
jgi:hypothetical protein